MIVSNNSTNTETNEFGDTVVAKSLATLENLLKKKQKTN